MAKGPPRVGVSALNKRIDLAQSSRQARDGSAKGKSGEKAEFLFQYNLKRL